MPAERYDRSDSELTEAVLLERERCAHILDAQADRQDEACRKAGGWYVEDGTKFRDMAQDIRSGKTAEEL